MRSFRLFLVPLAALICQAADPIEIARQTVRNYQTDQSGMLRYAYTEVDDDKSKGVETMKVTTIEGTPYERVVSRGGKLLTADEANQEQKKQDRATAARAAETPEQRSKRLKAFEDQVKFLEEAPDAFNFTLLPEETVDGRQAYVIGCTPKPGFHPRHLRSKLLTKVEAKAWVDVQDLRILKIQADVTAPVAFGWVLARVATGTHMEMEQMRLDSGAWVLKRLAINGTAKIMLVDNKKWVESVLYSEYSPLTSTTSSR